MELNSTRNCPGLEILDFRPHYPCYNVTDKRPCEEAWPCELREYWLELHPFVDITRAFLSYGTVVIIVLGVLLNALSFYILVSSGLAKNGSGIYLLALAICDSGNLLANYAIGVWRGASLEFNQYFMDNEWLCRFHGVFVEIFQTISAWVVVAFTVERCLAVWYPMILRHTRKSRSKIVVGCLTSVFTLFCLSKLFLTGFEKDSVFGYKPCHSRRFVWQGMAYIRVAIQTWIPTIVVFVFNSLMFWKLRRIKVERKRLTAYRRSVEAPTRKLSFINKKSPTNPMLIAVSLAYLILVFPLGAVQTVELYWNVHRKVPVATVGAERTEYISWMMTKMLVKYIRSFCFGFYQINSSINFFLYFAAGLEFRVNLQSKIKKMFSCCGCGTVSDGATSKSSSYRNSHRTDSNSTTVSIVGIPSFPVAIVTGRKASILQPIEESPLPRKSNNGTISSTKSFSADLEVIMNGLDKAVRSASVKNQSRNVRFESLQRNEPQTSNYSTIRSRESNASYSSRNIEVAGEGFDEVDREERPKSGKSIPEPEVIADQLVQHTISDDEDEEEDVFYEAHEMSQYNLDEPGEVISHKSISEHNSA